MSIRYVWFLLFLRLSISAQAQQSVANEVPYHITLKRTTETITVDGSLDEAAWQAADKVQDFWQLFPYDTSRASARTEVRVLFNDQFLYISAVCYQASRYVVSSLKRDFQRGTSDVFAVTIDPFRDKLNGFNFAVNPYGAQREGLITKGQEFTTDWDNKWYSAVTRTNDRYVVEMAIPFKTLRYRRQDGVNTWLINFSRADISRNEISSWAPIPRNFTATALAFSGTLIWNEAPPQPGANLSLIPYTLAETGHDYLSATPARQKLNTGFDAKVAVTPSLNLDLTVNPDFAQVEVDQQVTNLSRFELLFPERRQFFLENSDLFGSFGFTNINPFFSRRIGLARNPRTGFNEKVPILAGARLSGRINKDWRMGVLAMQTARQTFSETQTLPGTNFGMLSLQRRVGVRSYLALMAVDKEPVAARPTDIANTFNRVVGLEFGFASANNQRFGKLFYHRSFIPNNPADAYAWGVNLELDKPNLNARTTTSDVGNGFQADVGYVPRRNLFRSSGEANLVFYPKGRWGRVVNRFYLGPDWDFLYGKAQGRLVDWDAGLLGGVTLQNQSQLSFALLRWDYTYLFAPFDPTNTGGKELPANTRYLYFGNRLGYTSNVRKPFFFSFQTRFGQYFNGRIGQIQGRFSYRYQPYGIFSVNVTYNRIRLPQPYSSSDLWLIGPKLDLSFSKSMFLTTFVQYNSQINNISSNVRFQWRYKPVSDLFIVYTDNYYAYSSTLNPQDRITAFQPKNRALVLKLTYWLNL